LAAGERTLVLAEGFSGDAHYGKTLRGVLRYRPEDVVVILDSARAGESESGVPIVGDVSSALDYVPEVALVGVATQGGRFPPAWRLLLRECLESGLSLENGLHEMVGDDPELREVAARNGVELRDLRRPPAGLDCPTGANLDVDAQIVLTVGSDCAIGKMTVSSSTVRPARVGSPRSSCRRARRGSRSRAGASPWTRSSPTSSRAPPSSSSWKDGAAAASSSSSRARGRSCTRPTRA
jgi:uncharacterized NAD-dependent epimerase/dehydratase family protein